MIVIGGVLAVVSRTHGAAVKQAGMQLGISFKKSAGMSPQPATLVKALAALIVASFGALGLRLYVLAERVVSTPLKQAVSVLARLANGDLTAQAPRRGRIGSLFESINAMVSKLRHTLSEVRHSADSIHHASSEIATGGLDLSQRTEETANNLQEAASSMEQLTSTVKQSADAARQANQLTSSAAEVAARGGGVVSQVVSTVDAIDTPGAERAVSSEFRALKFHPAMPIKRCNRSPEHSSA